MKGDTWTAEWIERRDPVTGQVVKQLTNYKGHSHHLYFTNPGWYENGRRLLFGSDRNNQTLLFSLDLETGEITQMTDRAQPSPPMHTSFLFTCVNSTQTEAYFWHGHDLVALDLHSLDERVLYHAPDGFQVNILNCTADGRFLCTGLFEDLSARFQVDLLHGYVGFREYWAARPLSRILKIAVDGSSAETVWEERSWIGHINTSPTQPHLLTFCHEGPWELVDNRIWGLDLNTGRVWKIRPREEEGERIGHEYWLADGESIGYHGRTSRGAIFGFIRYDNTERQEAVIAANSMHFHSNHRHLIVGDGTRDQPYILLWRWQGEQIEGPRVLCWHRGSFHIQEVHTHPQLTPDARVLFVYRLNKTF
ncbi:MAG: oligogalacturonide lyase, partial [Anaerolineae bacterium]|nr:oligogalacturonide lyase [Anaerolineae bacterium]